MIRLPRRQKALYDRLVGRGDVGIFDLYAAVTGRACAQPSRYAQTYISPYVRRLNRRLAAQGLKVEPGALKQTYRLVAK